MSEIILTGSFARDLEQITGVWADQGYLRYKEEYKDVMEVVNRGGAYFEDGLYSGMGQPAQKPEGEGIQYSSISQRYVPRYTNDAYGHGVRISHEAISDGVALDKLKISMQELGAGLIDLKNATAFNVYNRAFNSAYKMTNHDGKELCATDHPVDSGTTSNELATPAALSEASLKQSFIEMGSMKDLYGNKIHVTAEKLLVPRSLAFDAEILTKTVGRVGTSDSDINPIRSIGLLPGGYVMSDHLTSTSSHFIITSANRNGVKFWERERMLVQKDNDIDTLTSSMVIYSRFGTGWTQYNGVFGNAI